jgi:chromosome segregation ATPase
MVAARRADSQTKRAAVLAAIDELVAEAAPITVASVARRAKVSTWLVYIPELKAAVVASQARQVDKPAKALTAAVVATDLALARAEISRLRAERDRQSHQLRLALGARVDQLNKGDLAERVDELTRHNRQLSAELAQAQSDARRLQARVTELEDDLTAARTSLRRMIRSENLPAPITTTNAITTTKGGLR